MPNYYKGDKVQHLLQCFTKLTHLNVKLFSQEYHELYPTSDAKERAREIAEIAQHSLPKECMMCSQNIFELTDKHLEYYKHTCSYGYDRYCIPLVYESKVSGYIITAPICTSKKTENKQIVVCRNCTYNPKHSDKDYINSVLPVLVACSSHICQVTSDFFKLYANSYLQIQRYIAEHINEKITIDDICKAIYLSRSTICKSVKKHSGSTVLEYIDNSRIEVAKSMLADAKLSITQVSEMCGYKDPKYFSKKFKLMTGLPPDKYRRDKMNA